MSDNTENPSTNDNKTQSEKEMQSESVTPVNESKIQKIKDWLDLAKTNLKTILGDDGRNLYRFHLALGLDRFTIGFRVAFGFFVVVMFSIIVGILGIWFLTQMGDITQKLIDRPLEVSISTRVINKNISKINQDIKQLSLETEVEKITETQKNILEKRKIIQENFEKIMAITDSHDNNFTEILSAIEELETQQDKLISLSKAGDSMAAYSLSEGPLKASFDNVTEKIEFINDISDEMAQQYLVLARDSQSSALKFMFTLLIMMIIASIITTYLVTITTTRPIIMITQRMKKLAAGDLREEPFPHIGKDEIGILKGSYNDLLRQFVNLVYSLQNHSIELNQIASAINDSSQQSFTEINEQVSFAEETKHVLEHLLKNSREMSNASTLVVNYAQTTQQNTNNIDTNLGILSNNLNEITRLTNLIKEIALKSELLALNAALEGIHAGEAGRGFSLVATEMQQLAENVLMMAKEIDDINIDIEDSTKRTIEATSHTKDLSDETTTSAEQIMALIQVQETSSETATQSIEHIVNVAHQNSNEAKAMVDVSNNLMTLANVLLEGISHFSVDKETYAKIQTGSLHEKIQKTLTPSAASFVKSQVNTSKQEIEDDEDSEEYSDVTIF